MYGRRYQRKRGFKRVVVTLLSLVMLLSVCFPGLRASAEGTFSVTVEQGGAAVKVADLSGVESVLPVQNGVEGLEFAPADGTISVSAAESVPTGDYSVEVTYVDASSEEQAVTIVVTVKEAEQAKDVEKTLYEKLTAASTCEEMLDLLLAEENQTAVEALTSDELAALQTKVSGMEDDGDKEELLASLEQLKNPTGIVGYASTSSYPLLQSNYRGDSIVYWDEMTSSTHGYDGNPLRVESVTLDEKEVVRADSDNTRWSGGQKLSYYYGTDLTSTSSIREKVLTITPASGYYVTKIVVACCTPSKPYDCHTWDAGNAYTQNFSVGTSGSVSIDLPSNAFGHSSRSGTYFILVQVAPVPTPLLVEYDYGSIVGILENAELDYSPFNSPSGWTSEANGNVLGTGTVDSVATQFRYAYQNDSSEAGDWVHYASYVTADAKLAAANAGYYFTGWNAEYYTQASYTEGQDDAGNNYTYTFSTPYGESSTSYIEGQNVALTTNVRLIAQWAPITMTVTKEVTGLSSNDTTTRSFTIQVEKLSANNVWEFFGDPVTLLVTGNNTTTSSAVTSGGSVCAVTPGQYRVVETAGNIDVETDDGTYYYISVTEETKTVSAGTATGYNLKVTNTYNTTSGTPINPDTSYIMVKKVFTGITKDQIPAGFSITVEGNGKTYTLTNESDAVNGIQFSESPDGLTWTWKITNAEPGTYVVKEGNAVIAYYDLTASPAGILTETGANVSVTGSNITVTKIKDINTCKNTTFTIDDGTFFAAALTTKGQKCCVVITEQPLSASAKAAIKTMIEGLKGEWKTDNGVLFYSIAEYKGQTITIQNSDITVSADGNEITFAATCNWSNAMTAVYDYQAAQAGDIEITNSYTPSTTTVTITKTVTGNMGDVTKAFPFEVTITGGTMTPVTVDATGDSVAYTVKEDGTTITFNLKDGEKVVLQNVPLEAKLTVTENYASAYEVTIYGAAAVKDDNGSASKSDITVTEGMTISVVNTRNVTIDTGIITDSAPFVVLFVLAAIGTCAVLMNKRRYDAKF